MRRSLRLITLTSKYILPVLLMRILLDVPVLVGISGFVLIQVLTRLLRPKCPSCGYRCRVRDVANSEHRGSREGWHWERRTARTVTRSFDNQNQSIGSSVSYTELPPEKVQHTDHFFADVYRCPSCANLFEVLRTARKNQY